MIGKTTEAERTDNTKLDKKEKNYLIQNCGACQKLMQLDEGSVIFDGKWYHKGCMIDVK